MILAYPDARYRVMKKQILFLQAEKMSVVICFMMKIDAPNGVLKFRLERQAKKLERERCDIEVIITKIYDMMEIL